MFFTISKSGESYTRLLEQHPAATLRLLTVCASISGALFGYDTGVVSGAIQLIKQDFRGPHNEEMSTALMELIVSITVGFAALFTPVSAFLNIRFGRRRVIMVASVLYALGSVNWFIRE